MSRKALGRGLNALLRTVETPTTNLEQIPVDQIDASPSQPRRTFPEEGLAELAASIRGAGLVQPILVRPAGPRYQLVAGERRWRAARLAGMETIPAVIRELDDRDALELSLTENLLREDLNPMEVAHAYQALQEKFQLSHEEIADRLGLNRTTVTNTLRLLRLPPPVQELLETSKISFGHARALLGLDTATAQLQLAKLIVKHDLSVRQTEEMVTRQGREGKRQTKTEATLDPNIRAAVLELERTLGTRVRITGDGEKGRIEISYYSATDLNRIYDWIIRQSHAVD
jgi:ParB family chromosome partitioning protein